MKNKLVNYYNFIKKFAQKSHEDSLPAYAAQTAFFVLMSFFPFVLLLLLLVNKMSFVRSNIAGYILDIVPKDLKEYVLYIIDDVFYSESYSFTVLTAVISIWSAGKGIQALTYGLNRIYRVKKNRNYFFARIISALYTVLFMILCILTMVIYMFGTQITRKVIEINPAIENATILVFSLKSAFIFLVILIVLQLIYYQLPGRHGKFRYELPGAFFSSIAFLMLARGFSFYMRYLAGKSYMYGSLTSIILLMVWLYMCMQIILFGAQINYYFQEYNSSKNDMKTGADVDTPKTI